jgi:uncharacterized protein YjbI with pentapeptide repeats
MIAMLGTRLSSFVARFGGLSDVRVTGVFGFLATALGLAADVGTPWAGLLGLLCAGSLAIAALSLVACAILGRRAPGPATVRLRRMASGLAVYALAALVVFVPLYGLNRIVGGTGILGETVPAVAAFQEQIDARLDRVERALAVLTESVDDQTEAARVQTEAVEALGETMTLSVALDIVDRVQSARDGSNQGQAQALATLIGQGFDFAGSDFSGVSFRGAVIDGAEFSQGRLHFADLRGVSARGTSFAGSGLRLVRADADSDFTGADLSGVYAPLLEAPGARFDGADLMGANFHGADLAGASFRGADLGGAAFVHADLRGADLSDADLTGAHLVGALLDGANLDGATFADTNLLAAVRDPATLTPSQRAGACRHQASPRDSRMELVERWESDRFSSGYEFDDLNGDGWVPPGPADDLSLPVCTSPVDSAIGFEATFPFYVRFFLDRPYLARAGRREAARDRFDAFRARLAEAREGAVFFTLDGGYRDEWVAAMRDAVEVTDPVGPAYLDSDLFTVLLLRRGLIAPEAVDWQAALTVRWRLERFVREKAGGDYGRVMHWGPFLPAEAGIADMPEDAVGLFRDWTLARAADGPEGFVLLPAAAAEGASRLRLATGFYRRTLEDGNTGGSWPSHAVAEEAAEAAGGADRLLFAPLRLSRGGFAQVVLAFPAPIGSYVYDVPEAARSAVSEYGSEVELDLAVVDHAVLSRNVLLLRVDPRSARIRDPAGASWPLVPAGE